MHTIRLRDVSILTYAGHISVEKELKSKKTDRGLCWEVSVNSPGIRGVSTEVEHRQAI